jgi:hypothetical protein
LAHESAIDREAVVLDGERDGIEREIFWRRFKGALAQARAIESDTDNVNNPHARFIIDEQIERHGVAIVQRLRRG